MTCHLYELRFPNGKRYIGVTNNFARRWSEHKSAARHGSPLSVHDALRKYGAENVAAHIILTGSDEYVRHAEIAAVAIYESATRAGGYNISPGGSLAAPETRQKYTLAMKRRWSNASYREEITSRLTGRVKTADERANLSAALTGLKRAPAHCANISKALRGRRLSEEDKQKQRDAWTPARRAANSAKFKGRPATNGVAERNRARRKEKR